MAATRYTVEEFVHDFKPILESETDVARLLDRGSTLLERLIRNLAAEPAGALISESVAMIPPTVVQTASLWALSWSSVLRAVTL